MEMQPDNLSSPMESNSAFPTAQHDSDQLQNVTTMQLDENKLSYGNAERLSGRDESDTSGENLDAEHISPPAAGGSEHEPPSDTKPEVLQPGNAAQENEEPIKGGAESYNSIQETESSSVPSITGVNANKSTDAQVNAVGECGGAMQEDDTIQLAQIVPGVPLPPQSVAHESDAEKKIQRTESSSDPSSTGVNANNSSDAHVDAVGKCGGAVQEDDTSQLAQITPGVLLHPGSVAHESDAENKISPQIDDGQQEQQQQQQISPSAAGASEDKPASNIKLEGANTQETEMSVETNAGSSNSLQETEDSSGKQHQQDHIKSDRHPVSQNDSAKADSNEGGNHLQYQEVQVTTEQAELTELKAELQEKRVIIFQKDLEIGNLQNSSRDLETNFRSKLNEQAELLRREYDQGLAEQRDRFKAILEEQRDRFVAKEREMIMQKEKLVKQILHLEQQHAAKSLQGGSYLDDSKAATPALLSAAVSTVRDTGRKFTKEFMDQLKKCPKEIRSEVEGRILENFKVAMLQVTQKKFQYQAYMNGKLFDGFDNHNFSTLPENVHDPVSDFLTMKQAEWYQKEYFKQFQQYDLRKFPVKMLVDNVEHDLSLKEFCFVKFQAIFDEVTENHLFGDLRHRECILQMEKHPNTPFYTSFCKFAVSVWLVHRLAFAFKTPATTFVVEEGLPFDCLMMESAGPADDITPDSRVGFVVLPGFQVSQSTIPCEVYLVEKTQDITVLGGQ